MRYETYEDALNCLQAEIDNEPEKITIYSLVKTFLESQREKAFQNDINAMNSDKN